MLLHLWTGILIGLPTKDHRTRAAQERPVRRSANSGAVSEPPLVSTAPDKISMPDMPERSLHVLAIVPYSLPHIGGGETHLYQLADRLGGLGCSVTVLTQGLPGSPARERRGDRGSPLRQHRLAGREARRLCRDSRGLKGGRPVFVVVLSHPLKTSLAVRPRSARSRSPRWGTKRSALSWPESL